jgi:hypothetical protein
MFTLYDVIFCPPLLFGAFHFKIALSSAPTATKSVGADGLEAFTVAAPEIFIPLMPTKISAQKKTSNLRQNFDMATPQSNR